MVPILVRIRITRPEYLERIKAKGVISIVIRPRLAEADEADAQSLARIECEFVGHERGVQVFVVALITDLPQTIGSGA